MSSAPCIGVLLCMHNGEAYIDAQLDSLAAQRRRPDHLEIHDWGSTDDTPSRAERWLQTQHLPAVLIRHAEAPGPCASFVQALEQFLQRYPELTHVLFCDQDDVWHAARIEAYARVVSATEGPDLVFSDLDLIDARGTRIADSFYRRSGSPFRWPVGLDGADVFLVNPAVGMSMMLSRDLAELLVQHREAPWPMHDWGAVMLCHLYRRSWQFVPKVLGSYRQHEGNLRGATSARGAVASVRRLRDRVRDSDRLVRWCAAHIPRTGARDQVPSTRWQAMRCAAGSQNLSVWYRVVLSSLLMLFWPRASSRD